ncbi:MAG TPA: serine hydrolase [Terriglobales bacterium]|jgi:CubicO group peptidase (beta-lactamase class C family)|nr:serine hydrolase [Terriglobales bacterium]
MRKRSSMTALLLLGLAIAANSQSSAVPGAEWKQLAAPEQAGWSAKQLKKIHEYVGEMGSTSAMIVQHGVVVAAWGDVAHRSNLHSCRKSLLNSLIGIAVAEGKINLDDTLDKLGIDDNKPSLTAVEKQATVRDLLEARSGVYHPAAYETKGMAEQRPQRGSHAPGTFWYYNNWDFNTLGYIYETATGTKIFEAFYREIAQPVGMQDFRPSDGHYVTSADSRFPAYLFDMSARDFARFALLYLHAGKWNNTQVVPEDWVKASTHPYSDSESGGYGYLWWTGDSASATPQKIPFPKGSFWAEGHLGQYAVVVPSLDLIIVNRVDGDITKREVHKRQMSELVQKVVAAAPGN